MTRPSVRHALGRALSMVAALPARAVGLALALDQLQSDANRKDRR